MNSEYEIRRAVEPDAESIVEFNARLAEESEAKRLDRELLTAGVRAALADAEKAQYFVAEVSGRVVGQVMLTREWSDWRNGWIWWFQSVYVEPEHRRRGVFRLLFERVREEARVNPEVVGLRLYVEENNRRAHETYRAMGMQTPGYFVLEEMFEPVVRPH